MLFLLQQKKARFLQLVGNNIFCLLKYMRKIFYFTITLLPLIFSTACTSFRDEPAPIFNATQVPSYLKSEVAIAAAPSNPSKVVTNSAKFKSEPEPDSSNSTPYIGSINSKPTEVEATTTIIPSHQSNKKKANSELIVAKPASDNDSSDNKTLSSSSQWVQPTKGEIVKNFSPSTKGIDYSGEYGQPIVAANGGKIVYSGDGLKGYGNLIIIKHKDNFLTAYAHNKVNLVKVGQVVKAGQKIATMGKYQDKKPLLHFELRQNGKPIDPLSIITN